MANIQTINPSGQLTAIPYTSGTLVTLSGVKDDYGVSILVDPDADGSLVISASDIYPNAASTTLAVSDAQKYAMYYLDGSKIRQSDGTIDITPNASGNIYAWQR